MKIIIDKSIENYFPLVNLTEIDIFEVNLKKFKKVYVFIDNLNQFYRKYKLFPENCIFLVDNNIKIDIENVEIENKYKSFDKEYNFLNKIVHFDFIREYIKQRR